MEPRKEMESESRPPPQQKNRRFRLVKVEDHRFRIGKLEERIVPLSPRWTSSASIE